MVATATTILGNHEVDHVFLGGHVAEEAVHAHFLMGFAGFARQFEADFVLNGQGAYRHANGFTQVVDPHWMNTFLQQPQALVQVGTKRAGGEEAQGVIDHDRGFLDLAGVVVGLGQGQVAGILTADDFNQGHLVHGREEVDADEVFWLPGTLGQFGDRQGRGVGTPGAALSQVLLGAGGDLVFQLDVFEHRLDDQVTALQVFVIGRGLDQRQDFGFFLVGHAATGNALVQQGFGISLTLFRGLDRNILEDNFNARHGRNVGDALTHHASAEYADLPGGLRLDTLGSRCATVDFVHLEEECVDHVLRLGSSGQVGQAAAFDAQGGFEVHAGGFNSAVQDLLGRWQQAAGGLG